MFTWLYVQLLVTPSIPAWPGIGEGCKPTALQHRFRWVDIWSLEGNKTSTGGGNKTSTSGSRFSFPPPKMPEVGTKADLPLQRDILMAEKDVWNLFKCLLSLSTVLLSLILPCKSS